MIFLNGGRVRKARDLVFYHSRLYELLSIRWQTVFSLWGLPPGVAVVLSAIHSSQLSFLLVPKL